MAASANFKDAEQSHVALVATELASNLVRHATGGEILLRSPGVGGLELWSLDKGPGMANVTQCLADGYSTTKGLGAGLGTMTRLATSWDIDSRPGVGTVVWLHMTSGQVPSVPAVFDIGAICLPMSGETVSGDAWGMRLMAEGVQFVVADGLGHGPFAAQASQQAIRLLQGDAISTPQALLNAMHASMRETRGAAVSVAQIDRAQGELRYAGVGNISGVLLTSQRAQHLFCHSGIVGHQMPRTQTVTHPWTSQALLVLHSDGLKSRWDLSDYPGLIRRHPSVIAGVLYRDFTRGSDDVTVIVVRELHQNKEDAYYEESDRIPAP
jgi:anti-sigma regulatory factor (Ser/Thr protein kinase)/serine/threonine protein phosphatase PrpC